MKDQLTTEIIAALAGAGILCEVEEVRFEKPKQSNLGDLSTNVAMLLAGREKRKPREIAELIVATLNTSVPDAMIQKPVEVAGPGFINFRFANEYLHDKLEEIVLEGSRFGSSAANAGKKANVEWVSANPTGPLHAGHGRQVCLGETICSLLELTGWTVTREYYFNNAGNQMQALAITIRERYLERTGAPAAEENIHYAGDYIRTIARSIYDEFGSEKKDAELGFFRKRGEEWCFAAIVSTLKELGVNHDVFFNEDSLYSNGKIEELIAELRSKDLAYDKDEAVWLRTTKFGADKDRVIVKNTGEPTYRLPDIAYHRDKIGRGYDKIIDIFGADHIATIPDVLAALQALSVPTDHVDVIIHQMVSFVNEGEVVRMSKRSGNVYYLDDLIADVGKDAVRYFFIMRGANAHLEFDVKLAQEQSENNPAYYLQYAHARIASILRFAESEGYETSRHGASSLLNHPSETALIKTLMQFPETVEFCSTSYEPQHLCTYLQSVATEFHKFYHDCRVVTEDAELTASRLGLCNAVGQVLRNGLSILGVTAPEKM
jgi:arginyl-tRNA synthetase